MKIRIRPLVSFIAILFVLYFNIFSFAVPVQAWGSWDTPRWDKSPEWETPEWETPEGNQPEWDVPEGKQPEWNVPEGKQPEWNGPEWGGPNSEAPESKPPSADGIPGGSGPEGGKGDPSNPPQSEGPDAKGPGNTDLENDVPFPGIDDPRYKAFKYVTDGAIFPAIEGLDNDLGNMDWDKYKGELSKGITKSVLGAHMEQYDANSLVGVVGNLGVDVWNGYDHAKGIGKFFNTFDSVQDAFNTARAGGSFASASQAGSFLSQVTKPVDFGGGIAGKAAPWLAVASTAISSAETVANFSNGKYNDGIASLGETLMSGAVVLSASGVGAPVAAGVAVVGGALWAGAKIYKHAGAIKEFGKKTVKNAKKLIDGGISKIKGWFGK